MGRALDRHSLHQGPVSGEELMSAIDGRPGTVALETWAGRSLHRVTVLGETPKRYRVRYEEDAPGYAGYRRRGTVHLVPKHAVTFPSEKR